MVAQAVGADDREPDMPKMEDRLSMARRVRGYVVTRKRPEQAGKPVERMNTAGRKALATMGHRGGQKAAQRWKTNPDYAQSAVKPLSRANQERQLAGETLEAQVKAEILAAKLETGHAPTTTELSRKLRRKPPPNQGCTTGGRHVSATWSPKNDVTVSR